ncbi:hypothetical protein llg_40150 [Luteolibacter sp. LG18]|nr:hypothetical protein llg_40150 [Luteolibacter sp. LG18]
MNGLTQAGWGADYQITGTQTITISKGPGDRVTVDFSLDIKSKTSNQLNIGIRAFSQTGKFGAKTNIFDNPTWKQTTYKGTGTITIGPLSPVPTAGQIVTVEVYCDGDVIAMHTLTW